MKTAFRHITLTVLALSILLGSIGIAFSEQFCLIAGIRASALAEEVDACCEKEPTADSDSDKCCAMKVLYEKLEPVSSQNAFNLQLPVYFSHNIKSFAFQLYFQATDKRVYTYTDNSPPLYGRRLLHQLHILIV